MRTKSLCLVCRGPGCDNCQGAGYVFVNAIASPSIDSEVEVMEEKPRVKKRIYKNTRQKLEVIENAVRKHQAKYFETGEPFDMVAMRLKDIAEVTNMSQPSICIMMRTMKIDGVDAKYYFTKDIHGYSRPRVVALIKEISAKSELSDSQIRNILDSDYHIKLPRRTVCKYRNMENKSHI